MSTANPSAFDPTPFYQAAANAVESRFKQGQSLQIAILEREISSWGTIVLRRIVDRVTQADLFELLVAANNAEQKGPFPVEAAIVGAAICKGNSPLAAALASSPEALAEVALHSEAVRSLLEALEVARAAFGQTRSAKSNPSRL